MKNVRIKPWIGDMYDTGGIFKERILVVGESHYCEDCEKLQDIDLANFTQNVVQKVVDGKTASWTGTFRKFGKSLVGNDSTSDAEIWQSVAFYNYLQTPVSGPRMSGTPEDYDKAEPAFFEVIEALRPRVIIVWGVTRMWDNMPSKGWEMGEEIKIDGYNVKNGSYTLADGHRVHTIWVYHPSSGYSWEWWNKVIKKAL